MRTTRTLKDKFGVFPHSSINPDVVRNGWYQARYAVAWYASEKAAENYVRKNSHLGLVVKPLSYIEFN